VTTPSPPGTTRTVQITVDAPVLVPAEVNEDGEVVRILRQEPEVIGTRELEERLDGEGRLHELDPKEDPDHA